MSDASVRQSIIDEEHLKLLSICYMISAAISACFSMMGLMYAGMGAVVSEAIKRAPEIATDTANAPPPALIGWIFGAIGVASLPDIDHDGRTPAGRRALAQEAKGENVLHGRGGIRMPGSAIRHASRHLHIHRARQGLGHSAI